MNMYELLYIVGSPFTQKDLPEIGEKIKKTIEDLGGKIINKKNLGNRKLAYPIKHVYHGFYILVNFELLADKIKELNRKFRLSPEILRHLIVKIKPRPIKVKKEKKEEKKEKGKREAKMDLEKLGEKIDKLFEV